MDETLPGLSDEDPKELTPLTVIRTETALSRFPVHRIAKKGNVRIELKQQATALLWKVSYNSEYGQPGPLAYKLDTLIVNRRIEEAGRPIPKLIRLGSLRDIAEEIGIGEKNTSAVKTALLQNAFAGINAKISYRAVDRSEKFLEAAFTRYSLIFTGETLPSGRSADAVYLVLNDVYMEVLNAAMARPLDYEYMKVLPPAAQRFYEIVSYQIFAALHFQNERARLRYSEYCLLSTATRYLDFEHVKKQMYKIHRPHLESGYLGKVNFDETTDAEGNPDWWMYYVPGPNASREYREFTGNVRKNVGGKGSRKASATPAELPLPFAELGDPQALPFGTPQRAASPLPLQSEAPPQALIEELVVAGLNRGDAERLAGQKPDECQRQLTYLPFITEFKTSQGAYLRRAIEQGFAPPTAYTTHHKAEETRKRKEEEARSRKAREAAQDARRREEVARVEEAIGLLEKNEPEAFLAFTAHVAAERRKVEAKFTTMGTSIQARMVEAFDTPEKRRELFVAWQMLSGSDAPGVSEEHTLEEHTLEEHTLSESAPKKGQKEGQKEGRSAAAVTAASLEADTKGEDQETIRAVVSASPEDAGTTTEQSTPPE